METKTIINEKDIVNQVILRYPETIAIFNAFGVDSCCGGGVSIEKSAVRDKIDVQKLISALNEKVSKKKG